MSELSVAGQELRSFVERIERLDEEESAIKGDRKDVYGEAKSRGYDVKVLRRIIRIRKADPNDLRESNAVLELYAQALGMGEQLSMF